MKFVSKWMWLLFLMGCPTAQPMPDAAIPDSGFDAGVIDGGGGGTGHTDGGLALKSACTVLNTRRCEYLTRCGLIDDSPAALRDCLAWQLATSCGPSKWPSRVEAPVATLRYDGVLAQACADTWLTRKCSDWATEPSACGTRFLLPNAFLSCYDGYKECKDTNVCRGSACPRSCQQPGAVGEVGCRENTDCKAGLFCKIGTGAAGLGTCTAFSQPTFICDADQPCATGLVCNAGKCAQLPMATQSCVGSSCDDSAWCLSGPDGGLCKARTGLNSPCTDDSQCLSALLCEALTGQCVPKSLTTVGSVCGVRQTCPSGTVCRNATATSLGECQAPFDAGTACVSSNDCQGHLACIGLDGGLALGCGPRQANGMRCSENRDCQVLSICRQQMCVRLPTTGDACAATNSCLFGPCVGNDAGSICTEPFGPGVVCTRDSDCSSNRCVTGKCLPSCTP